MFAKLYGQDDDQVLVIRSVGPQGQPTVNYSFECLTYVGAEEKGLMMIQHMFTEVGTRDHVFANMTEEVARHAVAEGRAQLDTQLAAERSVLS